MGRPLKYLHILSQLNDDTIFCPAKIAQMALEENLLRTDIPAWLARERLRIALGRFAKSRDFPNEGDGRVTLRGQAPIPGWFGWRWKDGADLL